MKKNARELINILKREAFNAGADKVDNIHLSKHIAIDVSIGGKKFRQTIPDGHPTDRGRRNSIAQLHQSIRAILVQNEPRYVHIIH